ncbi:hypothetical protein SK128_000334 [Halocaridina rubra]|uniref:Uncharacterized protein n=1 Tax=Halocaridina rubra TaxID=373956 RepID=A0AAN9AE14_HALRR
MENTYSQDYSNLISPLYTPSGNPSNAQASVNLGDVPLNASGCLPLTPSPSPDSVNIEKVLSPYAAQTSSSSVAYNACSSEGNLGETLGKKSSILPKNELGSTVTASATSVSRKSDPQMPLEMQIFSRRKRSLSNMSEPKNSAFIKDESSSEKKPRSTLHYYAAKTNFTDIPQGKILMPQTNLNGNEYSGFNLLQKTIGGKTVFDNGETKAINSCNGYSQPNNHTVLQMPNSENNYKANSSLVTKTSVNEKTYLYERNSRAFPWKTPHDLPTRNCHQPSNYSSVNDGNNCMALQSFPQPHQTSNGGWGGMSRSGVEGFNGKSGNVNIYNYHHPFPWNTSLSWNQTNRFLTDKWNRAITDSYNSQKENVMFANQSHAEPVHEVGQNNGANWNPLNHPHGAIWNRPVNASNLNSKENLMCDNSSYIQNPDVFGNGNNIRDFPFKNISSAPETFEFYRGNQAQIKGPYAENNVPPPRTLNDYVHSNDIHPNELLSQNLNTATHPFRKDRHGGNGAVKNISGPHLNSLIGGHYFNRKMPEYQGIPACYEYSHTQNPLNYPSIAGTSVEAGSKIANGNSVYGNAKKCSMPSQFAHSGTGAASVLRGFTSNQHGELCVPQAESDGVRNSVVQNKAEFDSFSNHSTLRTSQIYAVNHSGSIATTLPDSAMTESLQSSVDQTRDIKNTHNPSTNVVSSYQNGTMGSPHGIKDMTRYQYFKNCTDAPQIGSVFTNLGLETSSGSQLHVPNDPEKSQNIKNVVEQGQHFSEVDSNVRKSSNVVKHSENDYTVTGSNQNITNTTTSEQNGDSVLPANSVTDIFPDSMYREITDYIFASLNCGMTEKARASSPPHISVITIRMKLLSVVYIARFCIKAAFTPKWNVARGMPRGTTDENEHPEIYETVRTSQIYAVDHSGTITASLPDSATTESRQCSVDQTRDIKNTHNPCATPLLCEWFHIFPDVRFQLSCHVTCHVQRSTLV